MRNLKLIIVREYLARVRNKTFVTMTFLSPIIMVGMMLLIVYLSNLNTRKTSVIGIHDQTGTIAAALYSGTNIQYKDYSEFTLEQAKDSVKTNEYIGLLEIPNIADPTELKNQIRFYSEDSPNPELVVSIERRLSEILTNLNLEKEQLDLNRINRAQAKATLKIENFSGKHTSKTASYVKMIFGGGAGYLLMMFIIIYGNMVMRSVIEEKTNRIIEIIISSVKPIELMMGKILGTTLAGITQFMIWVFLGGILVLLAGSIFGVNLMAGPELPVAEVDLASQEIAQELIMDIAALPLFKLIVCFLIFFIGGYFLYSAIYAAIGAAVDNETDTQQFMFPVMLPLMLGMYVGIFSVIGDPHGVVSVIFSYIPLTSPIVMLMRIPFGVAWWEIILSMVLLAVSVIFVAWIGAKIYRVGILMYGKKPSYKEIGKWLKY